MKTTYLHQKRTLRSALLFLMLCIAGMTKTYAYDFSAVCETGQTLYYNITNAEYHYVELTCPGNNGWSDYIKPAGEIILPESVQYDDITYSVASIGIEAFKYCGDLTSIEIPNTVTSIGNFAFHFCSGLTGSLIIPNSVTTIGNYAFADCSYRLTSITIGNSVTSIGDYAFMSCSRLTSITIGNSVTSIGNSAFMNCAGLTSINIPNSVTSIGNGAFNLCSGLEQIVVSSQNTIYDSRGNCNAIIETGSNTLVSGCKNTVIPNSVTSIGNSAFNGCAYLTSITIPNSVTSIGNYAFAYSGLTLINIPSSVTSIGNGAFNFCSGLEQIVVSSQNTIYDSRGNCNAIIETGSNTLVSGCKNTVIPNSVTSIGNSAFNGCAGLTSINIPNSVTSIGDDAFVSCIDLTSISIGNSVTSIGNSAFEACMRLTSITIPNSVTSIGNYAFSRCYGLTSITIPNSVTLIGNLAFYDSSNLSSIIMMPIIPPVLSGFTGTSTIYGTEIYVPYESLNDYKTATNWSHYEDRIFPMVYTAVSGYGEGEGNWHFIASPLVDDTDPTEVDNMITETAYDLYRFNQSVELEWENYKQEGDHYHFNLKNGQGYLYANAEDVNLIFKGEFNEEDSKEVEIAYDANAEFSGWNLVGNPFPVSAYANRSYFVMNEEGSAIEPVAVSSSTAIAPCTGVMVKADGVGESVTFTKSTRQVESNGLLQIAVAENTRSNTIKDKAVVSFNEGDALGKFVFNKNNAQISIPQSGEDYAITCAEKRGEMPLNFKAAKNGSYTLSVNPEAVEMEYLHLIDNLTGNDIDLLVTPGYTFEAKTSDYASRFRLVFSVYGDVDGDNEEPFAFICNGSIIVTGDYTNATMQIIDLTGRVVVSTEVANNISINGIASGVYVLRLINGENVRTQKIVVNN